MIERKYLIQINNEKDSLLAYKDSYINIISFTCDNLNYALNVSQHDKQVIEKILEKKTKRNRIVTGSMAGVIVGLIIGLITK